MIKPSDATLFKIVLKATKKKYPITSWAACQYLVKVYMAHGGIYTHADDADKLAEEKSDAINAIQDALMEKGFKKVDDNSFIIGNSRLHCKTIANLLSISHTPWYEYIISESITLASKRGSQRIKAGDYFSIMGWSADGALLSTARMGAANIKIPTETAYALIHASRLVSLREKRFR